MRRTDIKLLFLIALAAALLAVVYSCSNPEAPADNTPPTVDIANLEDGDLVPNTVDVRADASDNEKVARVEFYINDQLYFTDDLEPWSCYWTIAVGEGSEHTLYAKAFDVSGNSDISETITVTCENTPPAQVTDLAATEPDISGSLTFTWTAPGDDGMEGTASIYDLRYYSVPITADNWVSAIRIEGEPTPQAAGNPESFYVPGLRLSRTFYFVIRTQDDIGNWSTISNVVEVTTPDLMGDVQTFSVGPYASSMTASDLDGDGNIDLAVGHMTESDNVSVLFNAGNGTFGSPTTYYARKLVSSLTAADIDNDGDNDLAISNYSRSLFLTATDSVSRVSILENLGDGTFELVELYDYDTTYRWCSTIGYDPINSVYYCQSYSTYPYTVPDIRYPYSLFDIMIVDTSIAAYRAHKRGTAICAADVNADGWVDLIVSNSVSQSVAVLRNNGDGTFPQKPDSCATSRVNPNSICAGDFNGDGWIDIANTNAPDASPGTVTIFLNNGTGILSGSPSVTLNVGYDVTSVSYPASICTGDVNGDSHLDLIIANLREATVALWFRNPDYVPGGTLYQTSTVRQAGRGSWAVGLADLCGDSGLELVVGNNYDDNVTLMMNDGEFLYYTYNSVEFPAGDGPVDVECADFDGDGDNDIAVLNQNDGTITILFNRTIE